MRSAHAWVTALSLLCCCSRPSQPVAPPAASPEVAPVPAPAKPSKSGKSGKAGTSSAARVAVAPEASSEVSREAPKAESPKIVDDDLKTEEREANPYSESVNLKLSVTPPVKALVTWGAKQVAHLAPGTMETELSRPRGSGPVDLEIKAEGYLPYHTRLYADRNDKTNVRLYRLEEAPGLLGYRRSAEKNTPAPEKKVSEKKPVEKKPPEKKK
jgi:hypothetical protein